MRVKIRLDTATDAINFANIASKLAGEITITDAAGYRVSAKSVVGALYALEFTELWCESEEDHYTAFENFIL